METKLAHTSALKRVKFTGFFPKMFFKTNCRRAVTAPSEIDANYSEIISEMITLKYSYSISMPYLFTIDFFNCRKVLFRHLSHKLSETTAVVRLLISEQSN